MVELWIKDKYILPPLTTSVVGQDTGMTRAGDDVLCIVKDMKEGSATGSSPSKEWCQARRNVTPQLNMEEFSR